VLSCAVRDVFDNTTAAVNDGTNNGGNDINGYLYNISLQAKPEWRKHFPLNALLRPSINSVAQDQLFYMPTTPAKKKRRSTLLVTELRNATVVTHQPRIVNEATGERAMCAVEGVVTKARNLEVPVLDAGLMDEEDLEEDLDEVNAQDQQEGQGVEKEVVSIRGGGDGNEHDNEDDTTGDDVVMKEEESTTTEKKEDDADVNMAEAQVNDAAADTAAAAAEGNNTAIASSTVSDAATSDAVTVTAAATSTAMSTTTSIIAVASSSDGGGGSGGDSNNNTAIEEAKKPSVVVVAEKKSVVVVPPVQSDPRSGSVVGGGGEEVKVATATTTSTVAVADATGTAASTTTDDKSPAVTVSSVNTVGQQGGGVADVPSSSTPTAQVAAAAATAAASTTTAAVSAPATDNTTATSSSAGVTNTTNASATTNTSSTNPSAAAPKPEATTVKSTTIHPLPSNHPPLSTSILPTASSSANAIATLIKTPPQNAPSWYDPTKISTTEKSSLPEWFNSSAPHRTPTTYLSTRNQILIIYQAQSSSSSSNTTAADTTNTTSSSVQQQHSQQQYLTLTAIRRCVPGDVGSLLRLHSFLCDWGLINGKDLGENAPSDLALRGGGTATTTGGSSGVGGVGGGGKRKLEDVKRSVFWSKERLEKLDKVVVKHIQVTQTTMSGGGVEGAPQQQQQQQPSVDWDAVAKDIGEGVSGADCQRAFLDPPMNDEISAKIAKTSPSGFDLSTILEDIHPDVLNATINASLKATNDIAMARKASIAGILASAASTKAQSEEEEIARTLMDILDQRMQRLENRVAILDDVEALLEAERVALELERRDMYTTRCRHWFGDGSS